MKYTYHYSSTHYIDDCNSASIDGIAILDFEIIDMASYHELKSIIIKESENNDLNRLSINSLTLLKVKRSYTLWWRLTTSTKRFLTKLKTNSMRLIRKIFHSDG